MAEAAAGIAVTRHRAIEALAAEIAAERDRAPEFGFPLGRAFAGRAS